MEAPLLAVATSGVYLPPPEAEVPSFAEGITPFPAPEAAAESISDKSLECSWPKGVAYTWRLEGSPFLDRP